MFRCETVRYVTKTKKPDTTCSATTIRYAAGLSSLDGGLNLHTYAPNPLTWIDPWGLSGNLVNGIARNPGVVRRFMSHAEYNYFIQHGFTYDPTDPRGGISSTSVKVKPVNPDAIRRRTGALAAKYYVDINTPK